MGGSVGNLLKAVVLLVVSARRRAVRATRERGRDADPGATRSRTLMPFKMTFKLTFFCLPFLSCIRLSSRYHLPS